MRFSKVKFHGTLEVPTATILFVNLGKKQLLLKVNILGEAVMTIEKSNIPKTLDSPSLSYFFERSLLAGN